MLIAENPRRRQRDDNDRRRVEADWLDSMQGNCSRTGLDAGCALSSARIGHHRSHEVVERGANARRAA